LADPAHRPENAGFASLIEFGAVLSTPLNGAVVQVVGYDSSPSPALRFAVDGKLDRLSLEPGTEIGYTLDERHCAGVVTDAGRHEPCEETGAPYCETHTTRWACARCTGECDLPLPACHEEHAIYLAAFAPEEWKVGVTRSWRLETRLNEQGADRAAHLRTVDTGRRARRIESGIAEQIPDRVRVPTKIAGLHLSVDRSAWEDLLSEFDPVDGYSFDYGFTLDRRPVAETTATGTVVGTKGRVTVMERDGTRYAVDLRDLVGHEVREQPSTQDRQSSLGAF
jgi:hypothetical protein